MSRGYSCYFFKETIFIVSLSKAKNYFYSLQTIFVVFLNVLILSRIRGGDFIKL